MLREWLSHRFGKKHSKDSRNRNHSRQFFAVEQLEDRHAPTVSLFSFTGIDQQFIVPAGVTSVRALAVGGGGGGANGHQGGGGSGYVSTSTLAVTPGEQLTIRIGNGGNGALEQNDNNDIVGLTAGTATSILRAATPLLTANGGLVVTGINQTGNNGGSGGGGAGNAGSPGGAGGSGGSNGFNGPSYPGGLGQGSYTAALTLFTQTIISAGTGGAGGTMSHSPGGGAGGVVVNGYTVSASSGGHSNSGKGGVGFGAGGGAGGFDAATGNVRYAGGNGMSGVVYLEYEVLGSLIPTVDGSGNLTIGDSDATGKNNQFTLTNDGTNLILSDSSGEQFSSAPNGWTLDPGGTSIRRPLAGFTGSISIIGGNGNDSLVVDVTNGNPIPAGGLIFDGGAGLDAASIIGTGLTNGKLTHANATDGTFLLDSRSLVYENLDPIAINTPGANWILEYASDSASVVLADDGLGNLLVTRSGAAEDVTISPAGLTSLMVRTSAGNDTIEFDSLPAGWSANVTIDGQGGADVINFDTANITTAGSLTLTDIETAKLWRNLTAASLSGNVSSVNVDDAPSGQIQDGINIAASAATVNVAAGNYGGGILVDRTLTLSGTGLPTVTAADLSGQDVGFQIAADNVILEGFNIAGDDPGGAEYGVLLSDRNVGPAYTDATVQNNQFANLEYGIATADGAFDFTNAVIQGNTITPGSGTWGIYLQSGSGHSVYGNTITGTSTQAGVLVQFTSDVIIGGTGVGQANAFSGMAGAVIVADASNVSFIGNTVTNGTNDRGSVRLEGNVNGFIIAQNSITGGANPAVRVRQNYSLIPNSGVVVTNNILSTNTYGIQVDADGLSDTLDGRFNQMSGNTSGTIRNDSTEIVDTSGSYLGSISLTTIQGSISGTGPVDFTPFLNLATDTSLAPGFQGDFSDLSVHAAGTQLGLTERIAEGYNLLTATGELHVLTGTFPENADLSVAPNKAVALAAGESPGRVVLNGDFTLTSNDSLPIDLNGPSDVGPVEYDNWVISGAVDLGNAALSVATGYAGAFGATYRIINNDLADGVTGVFASKPEGFVFVGGSRTYQITYQGGTGNDVVLTDINPAAPILSGTPAADTFVVKRNGADLEVRLNGNLIWSALATSITGGVAINGLAGNDALTVDLTSGLLEVPLTFNGGSGADSLGVKGNGSTIISRPDGSTLITDPKNGTIDIGPLTDAITYNAIEPLDIDGGGGPVSIVLAGDDDVLDISNGFNLTTALVSPIGTQPALVISGTTGGGFFESHAVWNASILTIDTTAIAGTDAITVTSANNAHGIAALSINTGAEALDTITVNGVITVTGTTTLNASTITLNANVTNVVTGSTATTVYVDDNPSGQIQDGINVAAVNATVYVASGNYPENLILTKQLTLSGAQAGVDARGRVVGAPNPAVESIVNPAAGVALDLQLGSNAVVVDGMAFVGSFNGTPGVVGNSSGTNDDMVFQNNYVAVAVGFTTSALFMNRPAVEATFDQNEFIAATGSTQAVLFDGPDAFHGLYFTNNNVLRSGALAGTGFFVDGNRNVSNTGGVRNPLVQGNLFQNHALGFNAGQKSFANTLFSQNTFTLNTGGFAGGPLNSTIGQNTFSSNSLYGLRLTGFGGLGDSTRGAQNTVVTNNIFTGNGTTVDLVNGYGDIRIDDQFDGTQATNAIYNNSLGSSIGVFNRESNAEFIQVSGNWWGTSANPNTAGKILGVAAANVDYSPWLTSGIDTDLGTAGFQGDLSSLIVTASSPFSTKAYGSVVPVASQYITEGYDYLGGVSNTLTIVSGTYVENANFSAGADKAVSVVTGTSPGRILLTGHLTLSSNDAFPVEINGTNPVTPDYDNWVVTGSVALGDASLPALTGTYVSVIDDILTIIDNDTNADAVSGTFGSKPAGTVVSLNGVNLKVFYTGNDGNDVILANEIVTTIYLDDDTWGVPNVVGTYIADADLGTAGAQPAIIGYNAFATFAAGMPFLATDGTVIVNSGTYAEAANLSGTQTLDVTGPTLAGAVTIGALSSIVGTTINIEGASTLTVGTSGGSQTIAGTIAGSGSFIKSGTGDLTLSAINSYTGGTTLSQGTLVHANEFATGATTAPIVIGDGNTGSNDTTLRFTTQIVNNPLSTGTLDKPITVAAVLGTTTLEFNQIPNTALVNATLAISKAITITTTTGSAGLMGPISGSGAGAGNTSVTFGNTSGNPFAYKAGYSGAGIIVNSFLGNVAITGDITLQNLGGINPAYVNGVIPDTASVAISGGATWTQAFGDESLDALSGAGTLDNGGFAITVGVDDGTGDFAGVLAGSGSLTKTGTGTQTLSGTASNTYTGATNIDEGTLALSKTPTATAIPGPGNVTIGNGAATAVLQINRAEQIANSVLIALNGTGSQLSSNLPVNEVETIAPLNQFVPSFSTGINDFTGGDVRIGGLGTLIIDGDYVQGAVGDTPGTTTLAGGLLQAGTGGTNNYDLITGTLRGYGTVTLDQLNNFASISPNNGANVGTITIRGNLDLQATSIINLEVTADGGGQHDTIAVTLNPNINLGVLTPPTVADPFTAGTVYFRGTLNVSSFGTAPANFDNFDGVMTFQYRLLSEMPFTPVTIVAPAGATIRQPTDFNVKNLNQAGPVRYDPRFLSATNQLNAISQATNNQATPASARLFAATPSVGAATKLSLTALTSLSGPNINADVTVARGLISSNGSTKHQNLMITVTNTSALAISGPIYIEFTISEASVQLFNKAGLTTALKPYVVVSAGNLAVGASASIQLEWSNPNQIPFNYTTDVYAGGLVATDAYSPGSSPGGDGRSFFPINGGGQYNFEITNATGAAASMNGWDMATVMPSFISPTSAEILFSATPANPYTLFLNTLVNDGIGHTSGLADNFNPTQNYAWKFLDGSHPATFVSGVFDPAAFNIVTSGFENAFTGSFSVELRDSGKNLYLVYTAPALPPQVTSINRIIGPTTGGTLVTILGANFTGATAVTFDGVAASSFSVLSATEIIATTAAHVAGAVDVLVTTPGGTASLQGAGDFTFAKPAITSVSINAGGSVTLGGTGTVIDLTGQNSIVKQILVTFNQPVSVASDAFIVTPRTSNVTVHGGSPIATAAATTSVTMISPSEYLITFVDDGGQSARNGGILNSGIYDLTTIASKVSANGDTMAADQVNPFVSMFGSVAANSTTTTGTVGDGQSRIFVDPGSLFQFSDAFGSRSDIGSSYNIAFDANLDGFIDPGDLFAFSDSFGLDWSY